MKEKEALETREKLLKQHGSRGEKTVAVLKNKKVTVVESGRAGVTYGEVPWTSSAKKLWKTVWTEPEHEDTSKTVTGG